MAWVSPYTPNLQDFWAFCYAQGTPAADLPLPQFSITNGGSGYTEAPAVTVSPPAIGVPITAQATISDGAVTGITVLNPGNNYESLPTVEIAAPPAGGTQATATVTSLGSAFPAQVLNNSLDRTINNVGGSPKIPGSLNSYVEAVYNLAFHLLLVFTPDQPGQSFFTSARTQFSLPNFRGGIVMAAGDQGSSQTMIVPAFFQTITLEALEATRTPWGRMWVEYEQMYGPAVWGFS